MGDAPTAPVNERIRVLVADDHAVVRAGLRALLDTVADIEVVGEAGTGRAAIRLAEELVPDVILMDVQMPDGDGIEATRTITARQPSIAVLVLTMYHDEDTVFAALRAGGKGYVLKGDTQHDLTQAIRSVAAGHVTLAPGVAERLLGAISAHNHGPLPFPDLTERERQVLVLLAEGHNNPAIARALGLASKTVANHVSNILNKLQVTDRAQATIEARRAGLGQSPPRTPPLPPSTFHN